LPLPLFLLFVTRKDLLLPLPDLGRHPERSEGSLYFAFAIAVAFWVGAQGFSPAEDNTNKGRALAPGLLSHSPNKPTPNKNLSKKPAKFNVKPQKHLNQTKQTTS
jgi:hypothetical protein